MMCHSRRGDLHQLADTLKRVLYGVTLKNYTEVPTGHDICTKEPSTGRMYPVWFALALHVSHPNSYYCDNL
jgi:hypothetical protein